MSIITSFRAGLAFFTRIPVGSAPLPPTLSGVVAWLPAVGLLVGALAALALLLAARLGLPAALCGIGAAPAGPSSPAGCIWTGSPTAATACWWRPRPNAV